MKPALSAEEWAADSIQRTDKRGNVLVVVRDRSEVTEEAGGHDHALAAIALHGKSFGFTQRHADTLRSLVVLIETLDVPTGEPIRSDLREIRDRVAALLPKLPTLVYGEGKYSEAAYS